MKLTGILKDDEGDSYKLDLSFEPITDEQPELQPEPEPEPQPEPSSIPLSYNDQRFRNNSSAQSTRIPNRGTLENKSISDTGHTASIITGNGATIKNCRVNSREAVRIAGSGEVLIEGCYLEAKGQGDDHADTIQTYSPGSKGTLKIRNTTIRAHNQAATAGLFVADNWTGTVDLENVVFQGGPFGARIHPDVGGDNIIKFKNVFFVGPFGYQPMMFSDVKGKRNIFQVWENVRHATIENGKLVPGDTIPRP